MRSLAEETEPKRAIQLTIKRVALLVLKNSLLALALSTTAVISAGLAIWTVRSSRDVVVPSVVSRRVSEAGALGARLGLLVRVEGRRNDMRIPPGRIVAQEPAPGSTLKARRSIRVWVSLGPKRLDMPAVEGRSVRAARLVLGESQVPIARIVEIDNAAEEGTVLGQRPPPGEVESAGEGVSLLVSRGPLGRDYVMPDLIGHRAEDVIEGLRRAGLKVADIRYRAYPGLAAGVVLRQAPLAGHRVSPRSTVSLDISKAAG
jgi:eukaryotic-like serine/threonine-protein kinase